MYYSYSPLPLLFLFIIQSLNAFSDFFLFFFFSLYEKDRTSCCVLTPENETKAEAAAAAA